MNVVPLAPPLDADDVVKGLRNIAADIEAGRYRFDPTGAAVVLAGENTRRDREGVSVFTDWQTHGLGKTCASAFAIRGVLASALGNFDGEPA